jgi:uncharacterized membrane protein
VIYFGRILRFHFVSVLSVPGTARSVVHFERGQINIRQNIVNTYLQ